MRVVHVNTLNIIQSAFKNRSKPRLFVLSKQIAEHEYADIMELSDRHWSTINCSWLEKHFEFIYWLKPESFCYYLPGIFCASIKENMPELIVNHSIIEILDRSSDPSFWDDFFNDRFSRLDIEECKALQEWILWLSSFNKISISDSSLSRAFDTVDLLMEKK